MQREGDRPGARLPLQPSIAGVPNAGVPRAGVPRPGVPRPQEPAQQATAMVTCPLGPCDVLIKLTPEGIIRARE